MPLSWKVDEPKKTRYPPLVARPKDELNPATNRMNHTLHELHRETQSRRRKELLVAEKKNYRKPPKHNRLFTATVGHLPAADIKLFGDINRFLEVQKELANGLRADKAEGRELRPGNRPCARRFELAFHAANPTGSYFVYTKETLN